MTFTKDSRMTPHYVTVREQGWSVEVPAIQHPDGTLEFASGRKRPEEEQDVVRNAKPWQVREFQVMRASV